MRNSHHIISLKNRKIYLCTLHMSIIHINDEADDHLIQNNERTNGKINLQKKIIKNTRNVRAHRLFLCGLFSPRSVSLSCVPIYLLNLFFCILFQLFMPCTQKCSSRRRDDVVMSFLFFSFFFSFPIKQSSG